jgi:hypothetical protein
MATGDGKSTRTSNGDYRWMRRPLRPEDKVLSAGGVLFLNRLPSAARPVECAKQYPRLVNRMAELEGKPVPLLDLLAELCRGKLDGRQGFSDDIATELAALRRHVYELGTDTSVWQDHLTKLR